MSEKPNKRRPSKKPKLSGLFGLGFDNSDGHKRITKGEKFILVGGSEETHSRMTETTIKTFEEIKRRHKTIETVSPDELGEIIHKSTPQ